jgi:MATE family multidrug resistance protein
MLSQLGHVLVGVADSVMVGRVGTVPLAAASFANAIIYFPIVFGIGISYGLTPHVAEAEGNKQDREIIEFLKHAFLVNMLLGLLLCFSIVFSIPYMEAFSQPQDVHDLAMPYLALLGYSMIPLMMFQTFRQYSEGLSHTKVVMIVSLGSNLLNVALNYILIFGKFGFEPMGLLGAGYATLISRIVMGLWMMSYIVFSPIFLPYWRKFKYGVIHLDKIYELLRIGLPAGLQFLFEVGAFGFSAIMIGWIGAAPLAAHQIAISLSSITYMLASGLAAAATIRVGNQLGKKDFRTLREAGFTAGIMVVVIMSVAACSFIIGRSFFPSLYVDDMDERLMAI